MTDGKENLPREALPRHAVALCEGWAKCGFHLPSKQSFPAMEDATLKFWQENKIFEKSVESRPEDNRFVFVDGPPFVSGSPHYAHLLVSIAKDLVPRYWTMKGKRVRRVWGWDCHGLPIEAKVNEKHGIRNRKQVEDFGVDKYVALCREFVEEQISDWRWYINKVGRWVDLDHAYKTMDGQFGESVIWAFKQMYEKGLIYRGKRTSLYSTETSTPVSEFEVAMDPDNYQEVEDLSVFVKFKVKDERFEDVANGLPVYFLSWTTTPWTLPSNFALAVNPAFTYVLAESENTLFILAEDLVKNSFQEKLVNVLQRFSGESLLGIAYEPLFNNFVDKCKSADYKVYSSDGVTNTEGTGVLHVAPAFGEMDYNLGLQFGLSDLSDIDEEGKMLIDPWRGVYIRKASVLIAEEMEKTGQLYRKELYKHRLPFYRSKSPLIYVAQEAYFVNLKEINKRILELNQDVQWVPEVFKDGRFREVVQGAPDWCISRKRYWGTVMPIWRSEDGEEIVIGSIAELRQYTEQVTEKVEGDKKSYFFGDRPLSFHRDIMDKIILKKDGKEFHRIVDILDVWLDSGSVPFAEYHYPFENKEVFEKGFPADFIIEYTGQIRAWFQILFRISTALFDRAPFKNVVVTGVLAGTDGRKMSKSYNNYPDTKGVLNTLGGDALRLYFMASPLMLGESANLSETEMTNKVRGVLNILWNSVVYFLTYAVEHDFELSDAKSDNILDRWINARLEQTVQAVATGIETYNIPPAVRTVEEFINDLSTWYIRRSRERIFSGDKQALATLYVVLLKTAKAIAPIVPFISENIYQELKRGGKGEFKESVHLEDYPVVDKEFIKNNADLLSDMEKLRAVASFAHAIRKENNLAIKQPLSVMWVSENVGLSAGLLEVLQDELNVKEVKLATPPDDVKKSLRFNEQEYFIGLATKLSEELKLEGDLRNLVRQVQRMRQEAGLNVGDRIVLTLEDTEVNKKVFTTFADEFKNRVGAKEILFGMETGIRQE
ncbi:MAG: isoleucine--tRNA ligase [bacterium]|nr:isoleucine--tRNA ligase [bacterium]